MENSDDNEEETDEQYVAMADTSDRSGPEKPKQNIKTSNKSDQKTSTMKKKNVCEFWQ